VAPPVANADSHPTLCVADDATFWPWLSSPRIGSWLKPEGTVVVLPIAGMADWGLGHPLDSEETALLHILRDACRHVADDRKPLVVPPLRFTFGAEPSCAFSVDQPTAHALIAEVAVSVAAAGFRKIVLFNSSPWGEELCGAAARDLRVSRGLHMFQIHLSALGLDFHPLRSRSRGTLQTLLTSLYGAEPEAPASPPPAGAPAWGDEPVTPLREPAKSLAEAAAAGPEVLADAARRLAGLLSQIQERPPLSARITPV
jgi:creatinine amidohydrolase